MGQKQTGTKLYRVEFKQNSNPQIIGSLFQTRELKTVFKSQKWYLDKGKCKKYGLLQMFPHMKSIDITVLNLSANNIESLHITLPKIYFPHLQSLRICGNNISSLESFSYLKADKLVELWASWNNLTESRSLKKCNFPNLKYLNLEQNYLPNLSKDLTECHFPELRQVCFQSEIRNAPMCDILDTWFIKWESEHVYEVLCLSNNRINHSGRVSQLKQKYPILKFYRDKQSIQASKKE